MHIYSCIDSTHSCTPVLAVSDFNEQIVRAYYGEMPKKQTVYPQLTEPKRQLLWFLLVLMLHFFRNKKPPHCTFHYLLWWRQQGCTNFGTFRMLWYTLGVTRDA